MSSTMEKMRKAHEKQAKAIRRKPGFDVVSKAFTLNTPSPKSSTRHAPRPISAKPMSPNAWEPPKVWFPVLNTAELPDVPMKKGTHESI